MRYHYKNQTYIHQCTDEHIFVTIQFIIDVRFLKLETRDWLLYNSVSTKIVKVQVGQR